MAGALLVAARVDGQRRAGGSGAPAAPVYGVLLAGQLLFYALALLGWLAASRPPSALGRLGPVLSVPYYFCLVNLASGVALVEIFRGKEYRTWASSRQVPAPLSAPPA